MKASFSFTKIFLVLCAIIVLCETAAAQINSRNVYYPGSHKGAVTSVVVDPQRRIISSGEDGFIHFWDIHNNAAEQRFQISTYAIKSMVLRPNKPELAFVEVNSSGQARVSVWNYEKKENIFTLPFNDATENVFYSAGGSFLMVTGRYGLSRFNSDTGTAMSSPRELSGTVTYAATGPSERSMVTYISTGQLVYWNLETGSRTQSFNVPRDLKSPMLIGNNRFLAGFDSAGLLVIDAVNGIIMLRDTTVRNGIVFTAYPEGMEFICMTSGFDGILRTNSSMLYHMRLHLPARLEVLNRRNVPNNLPVAVHGGIIDANRVALGTNDGQMMVFDRNGSALVLNTRNQMLIEEIAVSSDTIAFRTEDNRIAYIPVDYTRLYSGTHIRFETAGSYTSIAAYPGGSNYGNPFSSHAIQSNFILWQSENTRTFPLIKHITSSPESGSNHETNLEKLTLRFPLRTVSIFQNLYLFLDTVGNITIINQLTGDIVYTYTAAGAQDAVFVNETNILIARSASQGSGAFMMVNIRTGETVPLPFSAVLGVKVYRSSSGMLFGAAITRNGSSYRTSLVSINTTGMPRVTSLAEIDIEDPYLFIAEANGFMASTLGGGNAQLLRVSGATAGGAVTGGADSGSSGKTYLERSSGLPIILTDSNNRIISVDTDGNICWHDPSSGKIQATFRLYPDFWMLEHSGRIISGNVQR